MLYVKEPNPMSAVEVISGGCGLVIKKYIKYKSSNTSILSAKYAYFRYFSNLLRLVSCDWLLYE